MNLTGMRIASLKKRGTPLPIPKSHESCNLQSKSRTHCFVIFSTKRSKLLKRGTFSSLQLTPPRQQKAALHGPRDGFSRADPSMHTIRSLSGMAAMVWRSLFRRSSTVYTKICYSVCDGAGAVYAPYHILLYILS